MTGVAGSSRSGRAIYIAAQRHLPGSAQSRTVAAVISTVGRLSGAAAYAPLATRRPSA